MKWSTFLEKKPYVQICTTISRANKVSTRHHFIYIFVCGYLKRKRGSVFPFFPLVLAYQWSGVNVCPLLKCHQTLKGTAGLLHFYLSISKGLSKMLRIMFLGYIFFTRLMKNSQVGKIISVTFNNLCIVPHLTILENKKNINFSIHGLDFFPYGIFLCGINLIQVIHVKNFLFHFFPGSSIWNRNKSCGLWSPWWNWAKAFGLFDIARGCSHVATTSRWNEPSMESFEIQEYCNQVCTNYIWFWYATFLRFLETITLISIT